MKPRVRIRARVQPDPITPMQCKLARAGLNVSLSALAELSGAFRQMIRNFEEKGEGRDSKDMRTVRCYLESRNVVFRNAATHDFTLITAGGKRAGFCFERAAAQ